MSKLATAKVFSSEHVLLPHISYKSFCYPGDEEALAALKAIPGAAPFLTYIQQNFDDQYNFLVFNQNSIKVKPNNFGSLHRLVERCCEILSCPLPDVYVTESPVMNAFATGVRRTAIVYNSALLEALTADEIVFITGHEIGHIKHGSGVYRILGRILIEFWDVVAALTPIPGLSYLRVPLLLAYWEWFRRNEFTCDRAGVLCAQDPESSIRALAKLAGHVRGYEDEFNIEETVEQTKAHKEIKNKLVILASILETSGAFGTGSTHPFTPERIKHLMEYTKQDAYSQILSGKYEKDVLGVHELGARTKCPGCGTLVNAKLKFCPECGTDLSQAASPVGSSCSECNEPLPFGTKFCPKCGAKQAIADVPAMSGSVKPQNTITSFLKKG